MAIKMSGLVSGMDTESIVSELMSAQRTKATKLENKITTLEWKQETWKSLNSKIYSFYTGPLAKLKMQGSFQTKKATSSDNDKVEVTASSSAPSGTHSIQVKQLASAQFITGSKVTLAGKSVSGSTKLTDLGFDSTEGTKITIKAGEKDAITLDVDADATVQDFAKACSKAGLNAQFDTTQSRFYISSKESGAANAFSITTSSTVDNSLSLLGLSEIVSTTTDGVLDTTVGAGVTLVEASDATVIYNGAEITSSSNTISANGLTFTAKKVTEFGADDTTSSDDEVLSLNVINDTQAVYDMVKSFVTSYNEVLKELNDKYYAGTAKGYDPLTDEQKESMTDDQIEKWETKIKDSLLRRDTYAGTVINALRSAFSQNIKVGDTTYSLAASFGIVTTDYTEKGLLHIQGNSEDSDMSGTTDKLMKALNENPDAVMQVFNSLANKLYDTMTEKMSRTELNSALTLYNDKELKKTQNNYEDQLDTMEDKLADLEARYYKQFTAMEKAMSEMNAQSSSLSSMLGTS